MKFALDELANAVKKLTLPVIQDETAKIIVEDKEILKRKKAELKGGVNPDGSLIGEYRSEEYRLFKQNLNPIAKGKVDLIVTGAFANSAKVEKQGDGKFLIEYSDNKAESLISKYDRGKKNITSINPKVFKGLQKTKYAPKLIIALKKKAGL